MIRQRMLTNEELGLKIRTMRKSRGMTLKDLGDAIGQSLGSISMYETGQRRPERETLEALADVFNVSLSSLILTEPEIDDINEYLDALPKTPEARAVSFGMDSLSKEQRELILNMVKAMFPDKFMKGSNDDEA